jgi:hypothetical protein
MGIILGATENKINQFTLKSDECISMSEFLKVKINIPMADFRC